MMTVLHSGSGEKCNFCCESEILAATSSDCAEKSCEVSQAYTPRIFRLSSSSLSESRFLATKPIFHRTHKVRDCYG